jgi:hypothetical protein
MFHIHFIFQLTHERLSVNNYSDSGFSLFELLLAVSLSMGLILIISQGYLSLKKAYYMQQAIVEIQQNARISMLYLSRTLRMAGLNTCQAVCSIIQQPLKLTDSYLVAYLARTNKADSDVISIQSAEVYKGQCRKITTVFFIADTGRDNSLGTPIYGLYEKKGGSNRAELVENVVRLHVDYVEWMPSSATWSEHNRNSVSDWRNVKAIDLELLFKSSYQVAANQTYWFGNKLHHPQDKNLYKVWRLYVAARE